MIKVIIKTISCFLFLSFLTFILGCIKNYYFIYNNSSSIKIGYYFILHNKDIVKNKLYLIDITDNIDKFKNLGYNADGTILKRIVGINGDTAIITESGVLINNILISNSCTKKYNKNGIYLNPLPIGYIHIIKQDELWIMGDDKDSYDSRYFGVVSRDRIISQVVSL